MTIAPSQRAETVRKLLQEIYQAGAAIRCRIPCAISSSMKFWMTCLGFGPLQPLLEDPEISEVMVNGPKNVYIERKGKTNSNQYHL